MIKNVGKRILGLLSPLFAVCILLCFLTALSNVDDGKNEQDRILLEKALEKATVSCYALEGAYPPDLEYLVDNYGVQINEERFAVKYEYCASNLMPDITVLELDK